MKNLKTLVLTTAIAVSLTAFAHDPSMHSKKTAKLDCSGYSKMIENGTKMDMNDPVMLAMMKKCKSKQAEHGNEDGHHEAEKTESKCGDMSDGHHDADAKKGESKCGNMKDGHHDKKTEDKCGDKKDTEHKQKGEMKCGNMGSKDSKSDSKCGN
jgi:uncharacterized membrane protein YukC